MQKHNIKRHTTSTILYSRNINKLIFYCYIFKWCMLYVFNKVGCEKKRSDSNWVFDILVHCVVCSEARLQLQVSYYNYYKQ